MNTNLNAHQAANADRRGVALVISITMLFVLISVSYAFFHMAIGSQKRVRSDFDDQRAFLLADSGLNEAFEAVRAGNDGSIGSQAAPAYLGGGAFWVTSTDLGGGRYSLTSTALIGSGRWALASVAQYNGGGDPLFQATLNSKEQLTLNSSVVIDSFDSSVGTYASQALNTTNGHTHANQNGDARSNEGIVINANASVFGDATPGPGYGVSFSTGSYVSGSTTPAPISLDFPPIVPPVIANSGTLSVAANGSASLPSGKYDFTAITINKSAELTITGPAEIVVDDFYGGKLGKLFVDATNGPVTITVRDDYTHISGFEADAVSGSPMALAFMVDGTQDISFPSLTKIRGAYYAPNADIVFANGNECWGAFAANRISMSNDMLFHFDEDLLNHWETDSGDPTDLLDVVAWGVAPVAQQQLLSDRRDPMTVLGVDRANLLKPADAWVLPVVAGP